ncbi:MAG: dockerin type I domain-containing protein [Planctomycetota bacterium]|nr:dockerin type I domain-containing protein [Planctomycetota bacterium]
MTFGQQRSLCVEMLESRCLLTTLYDADLGTTPDQQGWLYLTDPLMGASTTQQMNEAVVELDSTADRSEKAGYFATAHPDLGALDRMAGFHLRFHMRLLAESHASMDRAGLSIIALSQDLVGIELGFWTDRVWAQDDAPLFVHAEEAVTDVTVDAVYDLYIDRDRYTLLQDQQFLLTGPLRDYSAFGAPYDRANLVFVGDDTSSAAAQTAVARIEVHYDTQPVLCAVHQDQELDDGDTIDFGPLPLHSTDAEETLTLVNEGQAPWYLDEGRVSPPFQTQVPPSVFLLPGATTEWVVETDTDQVGRREGLLTIESNDSAHGSLQLTLLGYVHSGPAYQNPLDPLDVNDDRVVAPGDAIRVVSYLNQFGAGAELPTDSPPPFLDVNGDDAISAIDAILVVNHLNERD